MTEQQVTRYPWSKRAYELWERDGHYADLTAWQEWIATETDSERSHPISDMDLLDQVDVYAAMCKLCAPLPVAEDSLVRELECVIHELRTKPASKDVSERAADMLERCAMELDRLRMVAGGEE